MVVALFALHTFILLYLAIAIPVLASGLWPENLFGLDGTNMVRHASSFKIGGLYVLLGLTIISLVLLLRRSSWVFVTYTLAVVGHAAVWVSNMDNPYYNGEAGYLIFMVEVPAGILLALDFRAKAQPL